MGLHYSGPSGGHPVYRCTADQAREGRPRCQEVRAPLVDAEAEHAMLALAHDRVALAVAALGGWRKAGLLERR